MMSMLLCAAHSPHVQSPEIRFAGVGTEEGGGNAGQAMPRGPPFDAWTPIP